MAESRYEDIKVHYHSDGSVHLSLGFGDTETVTLTDNQAKVLAKRLLHETDHYVTPRPVG